MKMTNEQTSRILTNHDLVTSHPDGFAVYTQSVQKNWKIEKSENSLLRLTLSENTPGLVMSDYTGSLFAYTKKEYQSVHNGSANQDLNEKLLKDFNTDINTFRNMYRTVGCGTNVYLQCQDGLFQVVVQRTAPNKTPEGVVQPGAYSRAAGGAVGDLQETQIRELTEELNAFISMPYGKVISMDIFRSDNPVSDDYMESLFDKKYERINELYNQVSTQMEQKNPVIERKSFLAHPIKVPGLHQRVEQNIFGDKSQFYAVVADDPKNGDLGGVDSVVVINMSGIHSNQIKISDGETNQDGKFLNRTWALHRPEYLEEQRQNGGMKFSPAPGKVIDATKSVVASIS